MKKEGILMLVLLVIFSLFLTIVSAQNSTEEKAYSCLEKNVEDKCSSLTLEEQAFSLLALSYNSAISSKCKNALNSKSSNNECYPSSGCKIKETALALLALDNLNENTDKIESWLLSKTKNPTELEWYLEIESSQATTCTITYNLTKATISIGEDKKISSNAGSCLSRAYDNYFLEIDNSCLNRNFIVSCDKDFLSTILYKKTGSSIWHVSSQVNSSSSGGQTENKVDSFCFSTSTSCDYEGSLWASLALQKAGNNTGRFLPYLTALSEDNEKYFPYTFLYYLTDEEGDLQQILFLQETDGYWDLEEKGKFYDTSLALLVLPDSEAESEAKEWLGQGQETSGCWNSENIRDTAFLLWAAYPKLPVTGGEEPNDCKDYNYYCMTNSECLDASGNKLENYLCPSPKICCDKPSIETCEEKSGTICPAGKKCSILETTASDTQYCCLGACNEIKTKCEQTGTDYSCKTECLSSEEKADYGCNSGDVCCKEKAEGKSYWWIYVLIILIILIIIGIIFRNKLRMFIFRITGGYKKGPVTKTYPPFFPPSASPGSFRGMMPMPRQIPLRRTAAKTDKELEDTLKKLKEMSR